MNRKQIPPTTPTDRSADGVRIAKLLARAGVGSRRDIEKMLAQGRIAQSGTPVTNPATRLHDIHTITVDGKPIKPAEPTRLWRYHKPAGVVTTHRDPQGRPTVFSTLAADLPRVISVGRLDVNSEGLLLLTNDGALARWLELPTTGWTRRYRVRVWGRPDPAAFEPLERGITLDGYHYGPIEISIERGTGANNWLSVSLREGKNREIRRVMESLDLRVNRLIRTAFGPFHLGVLKIGQTEEIPASVVRSYFGDSLKTGKFEIRVSDDAHRRG